MRVITGIAVVGLIVLILFVGNQQRNMDTTSAPVKVAPSGNPDYVQVLGLSGIPTDAHTVRIVGEDGSVWYREEEAGISLACCDCDRIETMDFPDGNFGVIVWVQELCRDRFRHWSKGRLGKMIGITIDDKLVYTARLRGPFDLRFGIPVFSTLEAADEAAREILLQGFGVRR